MRKHRSKGDVAYALDALNGGIELVVDHHAAFRVQLYTNLVKVETLGIGTTADSNKDNVCFELQWT